MLKTIKSAINLIQERFKIIMLKNKIRKMESSKYLDLNERIELRESIQVLQSLLQQQGIASGSALSLR